MSSYGINHWSGCNCAHCSWSRNGVSMRFECDCRRCQDHGEKCRCHLCTDHGKGSPGRNENTRLRNTSWG